MTGKKKKVNDFNSINAAKGYKLDYSNNKLVCITNGKEVLRITRKEANKFFREEIKASKEEISSRGQMGYDVDLKKGVWLKPIKGWFYTTKKVYKQYIASLEPNSNTPAPVFSFKSKKGKTEPKNIFLNVQRW